MQVSLTGRRRLTRIDHDPNTAVVTLLPKKSIYDREGFRTVRTGDDQHFGVRNVAPRIRRAIDAERLVVSGGGGGHAKPAVVIDIARAESEPGEFTDKVSLLRRERRAGIYRDRVFSVRVLHHPEL